MHISNYENAEHRQKRLSKAARIAGAILGLSAEQLQHLVKSIHDHKGHLVVVWHHSHTSLAESAWAVAWEQCGEDSVSHLTHQEGQDILASL